LTLTFRAVVLVEVNLWSVASGAFTVIVNVAFGSPRDRLYWLIIRVTPLKVSHEILVIPGFYIKNQGELINLKLLVLWRMGIIESPLLKRNKSTDKVD